MGQALFSREVIRAPNLLLPAIPPSSKKTTQFRRQWTFSASIPPIFSHGQTLSAAAPGLSKPPSETSDMVSRGLRSPVAESHECCRGRCRVHFPRYIQPIFRLQELKRLKKKLSRNRKRGPLTAARTNGVIVGGGTSEQMLRRRRRMMGCKEQTSSFPPRVQSVPN